MVNLEEIREVRKIESLIEAGEIEDFKYALSRVTFDINRYFDTGVGEILPLLHTAAIKIKPEMCQLLINVGARVQTKNKSGRTALIEAVRCRTKSIIKIVDVLSDSVNEQDNMGMTALMFAATGSGLFGSKKGNLDLVEKLINVGADIYARDKNGLTALGHAVNDNSKSKMATNSDVVSLLKKTYVIDKALESFNKKFKYSFDKNGGIVVTEK